VLNDVVAQHVGHRLLHATATGFSFHELHHSVKAWPHIQSDKMSHIDIVISHIITVIVRSSSISRPSTSISILSSHHVTTCDEQTGPTLDTGCGTNRTADNVACWPCMSADRPWNSWYMHPVDSFLENNIPYAVGPLLWRLLVGVGAGAYTVSPLSSTQAILVNETFCVQIVTRRVMSHIISTEGTQRIPESYVELRSGRG